MSSGIRQTSSGITWAEKIDPKLDHFLDASWNRSLDGLCWILVPKSILGWLCLPTRHQTSNKIVKRSMPRCILSWAPYVECFGRCMYPTSAHWISKKALFLLKTLFLRSNGSKLETYTDQKELHKWSPRWNASWHWSFNDFVRCLVPSW